MSPALRLAVAEEKLRVIASIADDAIWSPEQRMAALVDIVNVIRSPELLKKSQPGLYDLLRTDPHPKEDF